MDEERRAFVRTAQENQRALDELRCPRHHQLEPLRAVRSSAAMGRFLRSSATGVRGSSGLTIHRTDARIQVALARGSWAWVGMDGTSAIDAYAICQRVASAKLHVPARRCHMMHRHNNVCAMRLHTGHSRLSPESRHSPEVAWR